MKAARKALQRRLQEDGLALEKVRVVGDGEVESVDVVVVVNRRQAREYIYGPTMPRRHGRKIR